MGTFKVYLKKFVDGEILTFLFDRDTDNKPEAKTGLVDWLWYTIKYDEWTLVNSSGGRDAVIYLCFLKYSMVLFAVLSFLGCVVLMPVNHSGTVCTNCFIVSFC